MAEEFKYQIVFDTALNPQGGQAAKKLIDDVEASASRATRRGSAADLELQRGMRSNADKAKVQEFAFYDLDKAMARTNATTSTVTAGNTRLADSGANVGRSMLMFSQGFEDAQYGMRGVLNNIPGLVMAMGGTAGIAGAVSIAAVSFSLLSEWMGKTEEKATDVADRIQEVSDNMAEMEVEKMEQAAEATENTFQATAALRQEFDETKKAANEYATAALSNAEKINLAQMKVAEALGLQVDAFAELEAQADRAEVKRRLAAEQAIATQKAEVEAGREALAEALKRRDAKAEELEVGRVRLAQIREELAAKREEKALLESQAKNADPFRGPDLGGFQGTIQEKANESVRLIEQGKGAKEKLDALDFKTVLEGLQKSADALSEQFEGEFSEVSRKLTSSEIAVDKIRTELEDKAAAADVKIQEISETLSADDFLAKADLAVEKGKQLAAELDGAVGKITAGNDAQKAAKESILAATSDGQVTADETLELARNMTTLSGGIQAGINGVKGNTAELVTLMRGFQQDVTTLQAEIRTLKAKSRKGG